MAFFDRGDIRLRYRVDGNGPPILMVHGVGARLENWDRVVESLDGEFTTVRFDLRGHGETTKAAGPYSLQLFVADALALLDRLGIERCHVAGHSLGGMIAQQLAVSHPGRVDRLALL